MTNDLHDWQAAMTTQITRLDANQATLAANQNNTAVLLERLSNRIDNVRDDFKAHEERDERRPTIITGWMGGWAGIAGVGAVLLCSGGGLIISLITLLLNHFK